MGTRRLAFVLSSLVLLAACGGGGGGFALSAGDVAAQIARPAPAPTTPTNPTTPTTPTTPTPPATGTAQAGSFDGTAAAIADALDGVHSLSRKDNAALCRGNASTVAAPSGTISYDPRDRVFTIAIADTKAGGTRDIRFQDPATGRPPTWPGSATTRYRCSPASTISRRSTATPT